MTQNTSDKTAKLTQTAFLTALTIILTLLIHFPFKPTQGYLTLADAGVYAAAFLLGSTSGAFAGGIGTALADVISGYPIFAPLSLIAHGLQGLVAGLIFHWKLLQKNPLAASVISTIAGTICMVLVYLGGEILFLSIAPTVALLEIPGNLCQNIAGAIVAVPLVFSLRKLRK